jgi:HEAT repeat protein
MAEESDRIGALIEGLDQADKKAVRGAVDALVAGAAARPEIAEKLRAALDAAPEGRRWPIAYALAEIAPLSGPSLHALEQALDSADPDIRWAVALLLVRLAKQPGSGVGARLATLLKTGTPAQRRMALYCLRDIGAPELIAGAAAAALVDPDPLVRVAAASSLKAFPAVAGNLTDRLLDLMSHDADPRVRAGAAIALGYLEKPGEKVIQALENAAQSGEPNLTKAARAALAILNGK